MEDREIINLYWCRDERAISETQDKYGSFCLSLCHRILNDRRDEEECTADTMLRLWNCIPPNRPVHFKAFIAKICRNLSIDRFRRNKRESEYMTALSELAGDFPSSFSPEDALSRAELTRAIGDFLRSCSDEKRAVFMKRYFEFKPTKSIAAEMGMNDQKVRHILSDMRAKLRDHLQREGIV